MQGMTNTGNEFKLSEQQRASSQGIVSMTHLSCRTATNILLKAELQIEFQINEYLTVVFMRKKKSESHPSRRSRLNI